MNLIFLKKLVPAIIIVLYCFDVKAQLLTVEETISYLNDLSINNPGTPFQVGDCMAQHYKEYSITEDGYFTINEYRIQLNCRNGYGNKTFLTYSKTFHVSEIDYKKIRVQNEYTENIIIPCKSGDCINITKGREVPGMGNFERDKLLVFEKDNYGLKKTYNALIHLFTSIQDIKKYIIRDDEDPFSPQNFKDPRYKVTAEANTNHTVINLNQEGGVYTVWVQFGNIKKKFILDSGASELALSKDTEQELIKAGVIKRENYLQSGLYKLADGSIIVARRVMIPRMKVGAFTVYNVRASIGDYDSPLLLGSSFLDKFRKWSIDNSTKKLILEK